MASEARKLGVGIFVLAATAMAVGTIIWLGASHLLESTEPFVIYFNESIQGLDSGAAVKYRGVPSGRVAAIGVAPDGELVEVRIDLDPRIARTVEQEETLRATLELSGITGLRFIELDRARGAALKQSPQLTFEPPLPLIRSASSSFRTVQTALGDVYERIMQIDLPGISNDARQMLQAAETLLRDERIGTLMDEIITATRAASQAVSSVERMTAEIRLGPAVENVSAAAADARVLLADLARGPTKEQVQEALDRLNLLLETSRQAVGTIQTSAQRLDRTAAELRDLGEGLRAHPSQLFFSDPPADQPAWGTR